MKKQIVYNTIWLTGFLLIATALQLTNGAKAQELKVAASLEPSMSITLPDSDIQLLLNPQSASSSTASFNITVGTNYRKGYLLLATSNNTSLTGTEPLSDNTYPFIPTFEETATGYSSSNMPVNTWGYRKGASGNFFPFDTSNVLASSNVPVNADTSTFSVAAKVDYLKPSGVYELNLDIIAVPNVESTIYMQELSLDTCHWLGASENFTVTDRRDNEEYTARYIDGDCWMTQNLRITGTISETDSNFYGSDINLQENDLTSGDSYTEKRMHRTGKNAWYNFCAASAGTAEGCSSTATYSTSRDICPAGWRLPTEAEFSGVTDNAAEFTLQYGGAYQNGHNANEGDSFWWSATPKEQGQQYALWRLTSSGLSVNGGMKSYGNTIRCIMDNRDISDIAYMQEINSKIVDNTANGQTAKLMDRRDNTEYGVAKINGKLFMTDNLSITGTINSVDSNFSGGPSVNVNVYLNMDYFNYNNSTNAAYKEDGVTYYNYKAASASLVYGETNDTVEAPEDICPAGWKLPTWDDFNLVLGHENEFKPTLLGRIDPSVQEVVLVNTAGNWWSSTIGHYSNGNIANNGRESLLYYNNELSNDHKNGYYLGNGTAIRCVAK